MTLSQETRCTFILQMLGSPHWTQNTRNAASKLSVTIPWAEVGGGRGRRAERSRTLHTCLCVQFRWCEVPTVDPSSTSRSKENSWTGICTLPLSPPTSKRQHTIRKTETNVNSSMF